MTFRIPCTLVALLVLTLVAIGHEGRTAHAFTLPGLNQTKTVKAANGIIAIPIASIDQKARYFVFNDSGKQIRFFAVRGSNGVIRTAFDACDACYREKKGYEQKDDRMVCRNCNMKFPIDRLGPSATGGCNPGYLPHRLDGNSIKITAADLQAGGRYF
jgi:uncharacterized membrane protein